MGTARQRHQFVISVRGLLHAASRTRPQETFLFASYVGFSSNDLQPPKGGALTTDFHPFSKRLSLTVVRKPPRLGKNGLDARSSVQITSTPQVTFHYELDLLSLQTLSLHKNLEFLLRNRQCRMNLADHCWLYICNVLDAGDYYRHHGGDLKPDGHTPVSFR